VFLGVARSPMNVCSARADMALPLMFIGQATSLTNIDCLYLSVTRLDRRTYKGRAYMAWLTYVHRLTNEYRRIWKLLFPFLTFPSLPKSPILHFCPNRPRHHLKTIGRCPVGHATAAPDTTQPKPQCHRAMNTDAADPLLPGPQTPMLKAPNTAEAPMLTGT
jgi:hypothetical protein